MTMLEKMAKAMWEAPVDKDDFIGLARVVLTVLRDHPSDDAILVASREFARFEDDKFGAFRDTAASHRALIDHVLAESPA